MLFFLFVSNAFSSKVYVMAPLDILDNSQNINNLNTLQSWLQKLKDAKVDGIMLDVWWGLCEKSARLYDFTGYQKLFDLFTTYSLKVIPVFSFHQCGGNVGDCCNIPLPSFVLTASNKPFYVDADGHVDPEYISLAYDSIYVNGRTPLEMYQQFMSAFNSKFQSYISSGKITQIEIGLGPAGELRYPSYQLQYWTYPGCGQFQSFDPQFTKMVQAAAKSAGHSDWGHSPNTGNYNVQPGGSDFWNDGSSTGWKSDYGQWFIKWYSAQLITHAQNILKSARSVFRSCQLSAKIAGIHWWYNVACHCAETTAGFNNFLFYNGYKDILKAFATYSVDVCFTCLEMTGGQYGSNPQGLVNQILQAAKNIGIRFEGENALPCYDADSYNRIYQWATQGLTEFTYLRLCSDLVDNNVNYNEFKAFVTKMHG